MNGDASVETDPEIIKDFFDEFDEMFEIINNSIDNIGKNKADKDDIDALFRSIHSIKSNMRMVGLKEIADLIHHLENCLDNIRKGNFSYDIDLGSVIILTIEESRLAAERFFNGKPSLEELLYIGNAIEHLCNPDKKMREEAIKVALGLLDPFEKKSIDNNLENNTLNVSTEDELEDHTVKIVEYPYEKEDLAFFKNLSEAIEQRLQDNIGRIKLISDVSLAMNKHAGSPIPDIQLQAAIYLNSWGLALLPLSITKAKNNNGEQEKRWLKEHPLLTHQVFHFMPNWRIAAEIVLQCYERPDGTGYPRGLKNIEICHGSKILAIATTFIDIVYSQHNSSKSTRTKMSAIMEINKLAGTKFSEYWTDIFNKVIKDLHTNHKLD